MPAQLSFRIAILSAYDRLHDHKVVHRDISGRHILRHPGNGQPRIIDLEGALWVGDLDKDTQTAMIRKEQEDVQQLVDSPIQ
jgi:serine/threonine protein kinase